MKEFWWIWREISLWGRGGAGIYLGVAILWNLLFNEKYREIRQYPRNTAKKLKLWLNFVRGTIFSRKWQQYMINFFLLYVKNIHRYADRYFLTTFIWWNSAETVLPGIPGIPVRSATGIDIPIPVIPLIFNSSLKSIPGLTDSILLYNKYLIGCNTLSEYHIYYTKSYGM